MRNCTLQNIAVAFATIFALLFFGGVSAFSQKVYKCYYTGDNGDRSADYKESESAGSMCPALQGNTRVVISGNVRNVAAMSGSSIPNNLSSYGLPASLYLYVVEPNPDGGEPIMTELDHIDKDNASDGLSPNGYIGDIKNSKGVVRYQMTVNTFNFSNVTGSMRLKDIAAFPYVDATYIGKDGSNLNVSTEDLQGKTLMVRINFCPSLKNTTISNIVEIYFDFIGAEFASYQVLEDDDSPNNLNPGDTRAYFSPCPGDEPVEMKVKGDTYLYHSESSYLGNSYTARYMWKLVTDSWGRAADGYVNNRVTGSSVYRDSTITKQVTSGSAEYIPYIAVFQNGVNTGCEFSSANTYDIYLFQKLEAYNSFTNLTSGVSLSEVDASDNVDKFYACYGEDVEYSPTFKQDIDGSVEELSSNVYWAIYEIDEDGNILNTLQDYTDYYGGDVYTFSNLTKTTRVKVVAEYFDDYDLSQGALHRNGEIESNPCPTEKIFTIEVRQVSASTELTLPSEKVCEDSDPEIKATVSNLPAGDSASDYAYRWYYSSDAGDTYNDLNTTDFVKNGDADWSDPTAGITTTIKGIQHPTNVDDVIVKFVLANTYKVGDDTYYCEIPTEDKFTVYYRPVLDNPEDAIACAGQPVSFQVVLNENSAIPYNNGYGMNYYITEDTTTFASALGDKAVVIYGDENGNMRNDGVADDSYSLKRYGLTGGYVWWAIEKTDPSVGTYTFYTRVQNEETTCFSRPVKSTIHVLPVPEMSVTADPTSLCLNTNPVDVELTASLGSNYEGFDYSQAGKTSSSVKYHYNWNYPNGEFIDSVTVDSNPYHLTDVRIAHYAGDAKVSVFASDNYGCGYELNFDGTAKTDASGQFVQNAVTPATAVVKINPKSVFSIETPTTPVCANSGKVDIKLASLDSRDVQFTFTPKSGTVITNSNSPVTVSGNSNGVFTVYYDESSIDDDQTLEFEVLVHDASNNEQSCDSVTSISFKIHERPQLSAIPNIQICYAQPTQFTVNFDKNIPVPSAGLTYAIYSDAAGTTEAANCTATTSATSTQSASITYGLSSDFSAAYSAGGKVTLYASVVDETTGCQSNLVPFVVTILPQPTITGISFSDNAFCRNADASALEVSATLDGSYDSFYANNTDVTKPTMTYHWSWTNGKGNAIGNKDVTDSNILTDAFSGLTSEVSHTVASNNQPLFSLYVTDSNNCGYVLNNDGSATSTPVQQFSNSISINPLPYPYVEANVMTCANEEKAIVHVGSNDSRALALTFTAAAGSPADFTSSLNVAANSQNTEFVANFKESDISDITTYSYVISANDYYPGCVSADSTFSFTVYPTPVLTLSPAEGKRYVCQGSSIALSVLPSIKENGKVGADSKYSYSWSVDGEVVASTKAFSWSVPEDAAAGDHTVSVTVSYQFADGHVCTKDAQMTVFVNPRPTLTLTTADATICEGNSTKLTATVTNGFDANHTNWSSANAFTASISPDVTSNYLYDYAWEYEVAPTKTQEYSFNVVNDVTGCTAAEPAKVTVNVDRKAHFRVTALSTKELCEGNHDIELTISAVNPEEFTSVDWSTLTATGYTVVSASDTKIVINGNFSVDAAKPTASVSVKLGASVLSGRTTPGCDVVFDNDLELTVRPVPAAPVIAFSSSSSGNDWVCLGQDQQIAYTISSKIENGYTFQWFVGDDEPSADATPSATTTSRSPIFTIKTQSYTKSTKIWARVIDSRYSATACPSAFASYDLTINPVPSPSYSIADVCENDKGTIEITAPLADATHTYTYTFYSANNTTTPLQSSNANTYETSALSRTTNYYISVAQNETGCKSDNMQVSVRVNKKPVGKASVAYTDATGSSTITDPLGKTIKRAAFCEGEQGKATITLNPTMQTAGTAFTSELVAVSSGNISDWSKESEDVWSCASTKVWDEACTLTFKVTDSSTSCESNDFTAVVNVKPGMPAPAIQINDEAVEVCYDENETISLSLSSTYSYASSTVAFVYYMYDAATGAQLAGPLSSASGSYRSNTKTLINNTSVIFKAYAYDSASGCMSPASNEVAITVNPLPVPTLTVSHETLCPGETSVISVNETYRSYNWLDADIQGLKLQSVTASPTKTTTYRVQVTDNKGCESLPVGKTITVYPKPSFSLVAEPAIVCQGSNDDVVIKITADNDMNSSATEKIAFDYPYTFSTKAPSTGVVTTRVNDDGETEYVVTGHTWQEATESFSAYIYSTADYNSCVSDEETVTVTVVGALAKPELESTSPQDGSKTTDVHVCEGSTQTLTVSVTNRTAYPTAGNVEYSYHWYTDAAGTNEITSGSDYSVDLKGGVIKFVPKSNITLYVKTIRNTEPQCSSEISDPVIITIEPIPSAPVALDADPAYVCQPEMEGSNVNLNVQNPANDNVYHWYDALTDTELGTVNGTSSFVITAPTATSTFYARTESRYGCLSTDKSNVIEVTVGTNPVIKSVTAPDADICSGSGINFAVGVEGDHTGVTYVYTVESSNPGSSLFGNGTIDGEGKLEISSVNVSETETLTYTLHAVFANVCYSENEVVYKVTVHGNPTVGSVTATPNPVCEGEAISIAITNIVSHDGQSTLKEVRIVDANGNNIASQTDVVTGYDVNFDVTDLKNGLTHDMLPLSYEVEDANCILSKEIDIVLNDIPSFEVISKDGGVLTDGKVNFCRNDNVTLGLKADMPDTDSQGNALEYYYSWFKDGVELGIRGAATTSETANYTLSNVTPSYSGVYRLDITTYRDGVMACTSSSSIEILVNELPVAVIDGDNLAGYYCTDGDMDLYGNEDMTQYDWSIVVGSETINVVKTQGDADFDNHIVKSLADLNVTTDTNFKVYLKVTDQNGCVSLATETNVFTAVPPVINAVYGNETCGDNSFIISVDQNRDNYEIALYDETGTDLVPDCSYDATTHSVTTSSSLAEGTYVIRVTDLDTQCTTDTDVELKRYDIEPSFELIPDPENRFYCYNSQVAFDITLEENNGHDDFFDRIEDVNVDVYYMYESGEIHREAPATLTENKLHIEFYPNDPNYDFVPSDKPYTVHASVTYKFKSDENSYLSCAKEGQQNLRIVEVPVITTTPELPICLDSDVEFIVGQDNITADEANRKYIFYVNGVQVVNEGDDYSSNIFNTADHPEISLAEGDKVSAQVVMDSRNNICTSDPVVVSFKGDFNPQIENVNTSDFLCLGSDITFDIASKTPARIDDPTTFVLRKIKSYDIFYVDSKGQEQYGTTVDVSGELPLIASDKFVYSGEDSSVEIFAKVTDEDGCEVETNHVIVNINQFKVNDIIVTNENGDVMSTDDLCADIKYMYQATIVDGDGNAITPGPDYDFTFTFDGVEWSDHTSGSYTLDYVEGEHTVTDGYISMVVNVTNLVTGCQTDATLNLYKPYSEDFKFHAKPDPQEKLKESYLPVSDDEADARKFEICNDNKFTLSLNGQIVTVVYDGAQVAKYVNGSLAETLDESTIKTSQIAATFDATANTSDFEFSIEPSADFHKLSFIVSDGTCEVESNEWQFRMYESISISASDGSSERNNGGVVTLCQGETVDIIPSTLEPNYTSGYKFYLDGALVLNDDFSNMQYNYIAENVGTYELEIVPDFGRNGCSEKITIDVKQAPDPHSSLTDADGNPVSTTTIPAPGVYEWGYMFCENTNLTFTLAGAEDYTITSLKRDGVELDATKYFSTTGSGTSFEQNFKLHYAENSNDYSTYEMEILYTVGNCERTGKVTFTVYNVPDAEFINNTPKKLIIAGSEVPVEVTPGFSNYDFIVNGTSVQNGSSNTLLGSDNVLTETSTIEVVVSSAFGCDTTLTANVTVLEGIEPRTIATSAEYYCSEDEGVRITVVDPQDGVTYQLVGMGQADIEATEGSDVYWEPIRLTDPTNVNPQEFSVIGYYAALPEQQFPMANTVTVEEVKSPANATAPTRTDQDCSVVQDESYTWTVSNTEADNYYWLVDENSGVEYGPYTSTTGSLDIEVYNILTAALGSTPNGNFHIIARTKRLYGEYAGDFACEKQLDGILTIDLPTPEAFDVKSNLALGNICVDDEGGVEIYTEQSEFDAEADHTYILYENGVEVDRVVSTDVNGVHFTRGKFETAGSYVYSIVCIYKNCSTPMKNTITVNAFEPPVQQTLSVDNDGYFCYDANGSNITVGGQQEGYLYVLYLNNNEVARHTGDASGESFVFADIKNAGIYTVKVYNPNIDRAETTCVTELSETVEVKPMTEPVKPDAHIAKASLGTIGSSSVTVCVDEQVHITLLQPEAWQQPDFEIHYKIYDADGSLITQNEIENLANSDKVVFEDFAPADLSLVPGMHSLSVVATQTRVLSDGSKLECEKVFDNSLSLYVKNRPSDGSEYLTIDDKAAEDSDDPCYGVDIVINNPNTSATDSVSYTLYLIDNTTGVAEYKKVATIKPFAGDAPRFSDIRNGKGDYRVVAENGACSDIIQPDPITVEQDKYAQVQVLDVDDYMCQGDPGVKIGLMDSEENVIYRLYYVAPAEWDATTYVQNYLADNTPGTMISEFNKATFDHQRVSFSGINYNDGYTPTSDLISKDGYYYVICVKDAPNACPVASPASNFQSLKLPKSFNLMENRVYCDDKGVQLYVEHSEFDADAKITYRLYQKDAAGNLTYMGQVESDGSDMLLFKTGVGLQDLYVTEGTYAAIAIKEYTFEVDGQIKNHICTSALATEVVVSKSEPLDNLKFDEENIFICNDGTAEFILPESSNKQGVTYYLTDDATSPDDTFIESTNTNGATVSFSNLIDGTNVVWASYDNFDCLVEIGTVNVTRRQAILENVINDNICGEDNVTYSIPDAYLVDGLSYYLIDVNGVEYGPVTYSNITGSAVEFTGLTPQNYTIKASYGDARECETVMGTLNAINPQADVTLIVSGKQYNAGETVSICPGLLTMATINVKNADVANYNFYWTVDTATVRDLRYSGYNNSWTFSTEDQRSLVAEGVQSVKLNFSIETVCGEYELKDVFTLAFNGSEAFDSLKFDDQNILICHNGSAEFSLPEKSLVSGIHYYLTGSTTTPETSYLESSTYDGTNAVTFTNFVDSVNVVWASYDNLACLTQIGNVRVTRYPAIPENLINETICGENDLTFTVPEAYLIDGLSYYLVDEEGVEYGPVTYDAATASPVEFSNLTPQTYTIKGAFGDGKECETIMGVVSSVSPKADVTLFVNGTEYKSGASIELCPGLFTMATINAQNVNVAKYNFYWTLDSTDVRDARYSGVNSSWTFTTDEQKDLALKGVKSLRLNFSIETVCGEFELADYFDITIKGSATTGNHLRAKDDNPDYCEGNETVKLYYDDARKYETYRLYKQVGDIDTGEPYDDELMDTQEIPRNVSNASNILYFNGWGYYDGENSGASSLFASEGCYYVETQESNGCTYTSNVLCVVMHPSPIQENDSALYVYQNMDGTLDMTSVNMEYGILGGTLAFRNPKAGFEYYLMKDGEVLSYDEDGVNKEIVKTVETDQDYLVFGPIKDYKTNEDGTQYMTVVNDTIFCGEGKFSLLVRDPQYGCEVQSNEVTFVEEQLIAYDVEIYLNKNEVARTVDLIPLYNFETHTSYKANRNYIGWSSKIDRIYRPQVITGSDGYYVNDGTETQLISEDEDPDYFRDGYSNVKGTYEEALKTGKITYTGKSGASNVWFNIVQDPTNKISGAYGFINVDYEQGADSSVISMRTPTGYFYYMKQPSFYGQEKIQYYIENYQMPGRRSNIATITILCGNEETGDNSSVFLIPNAFSPNGDGLNDYFKIIIPDKYQDNSESKLQVFNRWGTLVYRSQGLRYGEDGDWWDGTSSTSNMVTLGEKLPSGTYYYVFTISFIDKANAVRSERKMHGYIELRR